MTVNSALDFINTIINDTIDEYKLTEGSKNEQNEYIPHLLEKKDIDNKLFALEYGLKNTALSTTPLKLIEVFGSTATELRRISKREYIRLPTTPAIDADIDIDEGLTFAVLYEALAFLWDGYSMYSSLANSIKSSYSSAIASYLIEREDENNENIVSKILYFRFSIDGTSWHDTFQEGDFYISFMQEGSSWTNAIKFVGGSGDGGTGGSGATTFKELLDTPNSFVAGKYLKINDNGTEVELTDPPTTATYGVNGGEDISGSVLLDLRQGHGNATTNYLLLAGDTTIDISKTDIYYDMDMGRTYILEIFPNGFNCTINFIAKGDVAIDPTSYANLLVFMYDGEDIFILNNISYQN